jgi:lysozyme
VNAGLLIAAGIGLLLLTGRAAAMTPDTATDTPAPDLPGLGNLAAFLAMIRRYESSDDYRVMWGGSHFQSFADHPRILNEYAGRRSTAAGAYQIIAPTWDTVIQPALNLPDFSPQSQDTAAVYLIQRRGALPAVNAGDFDRAVDLLTSEWEALRVNSRAALAQTYAGAGGTLA